MKIKKANSHTLEKRHKYHREVLNALLSLYKTHTIEIYPCSEYWEIIVLMRYFSIQSK